MDNPYMWLFGHPDLRPAGSRLTAAVVLVTFILVVVVSALR